MQALDQGYMRCIQPAGHTFSEPRHNSTQSLVPSPTINDADDDSPFCAFLLSFVVPRVATNTHLPALSLLQDSILTSYPDLNFIQTPL